MTYEQLEDLLRLIQLRVQQAANSSRGNATAKSILQEIEDIEKRLRLSVESQLSNHTGAGSRFLRLGRTNCDQVPAKNRRTAVCLVPVDMGVLRNRPVVA